MNAEDDLDDLFQIPRPPREGLGEGRASDESVAQRK